MNCARQAADGIPAAQNPSMIRVVEAASPSETLQQSPAGQRQFIDECLQERGAVLFRGFAEPSALEFSQFAASLCHRLLDYQERSTPRQEIEAKVYTSTEYPADQLIPQHNENSYSHEWPAKLLFLCVKPAATGGQTPVANSRDVLQAIDPSVSRRFRERGVLYVRNYAPGIRPSWSEAFQTDDPAVVEQYCRRHDIACQWHARGRGLRTSQMRAAVRRHPVTGQAVWFNQAHLFHVSSLPPDVRQAIQSVYDERDYPRHAYYGDGTPIEDSVLDHIRDVYDRHTVDVAWRANDVLVLDNMLKSHGRRPYQGERRVLVAMGDPIAASDETREPVVADSSTS